MTNLRDAPYFLLSGPSKYILSLEKADPSAKTYAMQYTWDKNDTNNMFTFSFDTPNSKVSCDCVITYKVSFYLLFIKKVV